MRFVFEVNTPGVACCVEVGGDARIDWHLRVARNRRLYSECAGCAMSSFTRHTFAPCNCIMESRRTSEEFRNVPVRRSLMLDRRVFF